MDRFEVRFDPRARRLSWVLRGFWTLDDVARFGRALLEVVGPLGPPPQRYDCLADTLDFPVQSNEVSLALGEIDRIGATMRDGRVAIVVGSMINKMQAERTLTSGVRVFLTRADAIAWLDAGPA